MTVVDTMTNDLRRGSAAATGGVGQLIVEARLDALNSALEAHGLDASRIITILKLPAQGVANTLPARFQVLYRKP